ncbi:hypothetical protein J0S82_005651 [Galemys pyrenaicus]|uniref:Uncharacterized protein n=1 Tax=Galemys pyrenaicus TaxID=202257 RepID=A0A8J6DF50_GALPY|nr:hypothetical protein J0S82_005651 [Galemys pyrenaicus]
MNLFYHVRNISSLNKTDVDASDGYCAFVAENQVPKWLFMALVALRDALLLALMGGARTTSWCFSCTSTTSSCSTFSAPRCSTTLL